jgi:N-acetylneuraminate synthase
MSAAKAADEVVIGRPVGPAHPPMIVAELSANHLGRLDRAIAIVEAAAAAGCDAIKLQTFTPQSMTLDCARADFHIADGPWSGRSLWDLYGEATTPWEWHEPLFRRAAELGMIAFSTPFDADAVDFLDRLGAPAFKIASFELVDLELIARCAATGRPLIMSTGMAADDEVDEAVAVAKAHGAGGVVILHCVSGYPTPPEQIHLRRMDPLRRHGLVGLSDHSPGATVPIAAVARGACLIEKHLTLARSDGGPDAGFSLEPHEMAEVVRGCRTAWAALGDGAPARPQVESASRQFRRSLYAVADIAPGEPFSRMNVRSIRPGHGLPPRHLPDILGRAAKVAIARGTPLAWELIA